MNEVITYRLAGTGFWGYEFFDAERNQVGFARNVTMRQEPVRIEGSGVSWSSQFWLDNTIVPGTSRRVKDSRSMLEIYRIIFWQPGLYEVRPAEGESVQAEFRDGAYLFGPPQMPAVAMTERIREADWAPLIGSGLEVEPYFRTTFYENVNDAFQMMVLSFPALRFY